MLAPGAVLSDRYRLTERTAAGGMGAVWRGVDMLLHRDVAIKVLLPALTADREFITRFRSEARMMAALRHPGIVQVYDYGEQAPVDYLVMEFIQGTALAQHIQQAGRLGAAETMTIIAQAADALQVAHEAGIVHRDVKPGNLLLRPGGAVVLVDFGVARSTDITGLTGTNVVLGSANYMAPEQAEGKPVSAATDVYALGAVAYCCLTGRPPYVGDNPLQVLTQLVYGPLPSLPPDVPPPVAALVLRALAKEPERRFPSAAALAQAARQVGRAGPATTPARPGPAATTRPYAAPDLASGTRQRPPSVTGSAQPPYATGRAQGAAAAGGPTGQAYGPASAGGPGGRAQGAASVGGPSGRQPAFGTMPDGQRPPQAGPSGAQRPPYGGQPGPQRPGFASASASVPAARTPASGYTEVASSGYAAVPPAGSSGAGRRRTLFAVLAGVVLLGLGVAGLAAASVFDSDDPQSPPIAAGAPTSVRPTGKAPRTSKPAPRRSRTSAVATAPAGEPSTPAATEPSSAPAQDETVNPNDPATVCGTGYEVVDEKSLRTEDGVERGRVSLLFQESGGKYCVVTLKTSAVGRRTAATASLEVKGQDPRNDGGQVAYYAGPVRAEAGETCVRWGGTVGDAGYESDYERCD